MQSLAERAGSPPSQSFAGLLAAFTRQTPTSPQAFKDEQLAEDVVSLSYERALRTHARYKAPHSIESDPSAEAAQPMRAHAAVPPQDACAEVGVPPLAAALLGEPVSAVASSDAGHEKSLKSASITIRVSKDECAQLHQRAAEAGLTVSAYLRSCTCEAETLRALVKEAMAQLKANPATDREKPKGDFRKTPNHWFGWLKGLWPPGRAQRRAVEA